MPSPKPGQTSPRPSRPRLRKELTQLGVNDALTVGDIPPETFDYRLGSRNALEWVIDQYQVSTDKRTGMVSDPNRPDDPEYIARLVVTVSLETVRRVREIAAVEIIPAPRNEK